MVLFTYLDAQEHLPYADDSAAVTPKSELNGGIMVVDTPTRHINIARKFSYTSHSGKADSYNSHTDLSRGYGHGMGGGGHYHPSQQPSSHHHNPRELAAANTKESTLRKKMASIFSEMSGSRDHTNKLSKSIVMEPISSNPYGAISSSEATSPKAPPEEQNESVDLQVRKKS